MVIIDTVINSLLGRLTLDPASMHCPSWDNAFVSSILLILVGMCFFSWYVFSRYWHQRADERHGNPPQGNQELLVVRDKVGRPQKLGVSKFMECDIFPSVL